jgi:CRISPR-associated protein Cas1
MYSPYFKNLASLRKKQYLFSQSNIATRWLIDLLITKGNEQIRNIQRGYKRKGKSSSEADIFLLQMQDILRNIAAIEVQPVSSIRSTILGWEGTISRLYFSALRPLMPEKFGFHNRSRRPALDYFNAGLNYLYGMTYGVVESGLFAKGLDPGIGIMHVDAYQKPTLAYDLIEPFRPVVDRILLNLIWEENLSEQHFTPKEQGYWMSKTGKRIVIKSFADFLNQRIEYRDEVKRLKDHIYGESNRLGNLIEETIELL